MKSTSFALGCILGLSVCSPSPAPSAELEIGDRPPPLELEKLLQAPAGAEANWEDLKGKVVVLEFWATWCGPCIAAIPHLNELAAKFKDKPVQFIAITDEDEAVVKPFLKKRSMNAWIGLDTDKSVHRDYDIEGIPHTVIVDATGHIAGITYPMALTESHLEDVLAGQKLAFAAPKRGEGIRPGELPGHGEAGAEPIFQIIVRPSEAEHGSSASGEGNITSLGSSVLTILSWAYEVRSTRIITNAPLPEGKYDFIIKTPSKNSAQAMTWLREAVETSFGLTGRRETREMDVWLLNATSDAEKLLTPTVSTGGSSSSSGLGKMRGVNVSIRAITSTLESQLNRPVLDETKLTGRYDLELKWEPSDPEHPNSDSLMQAVREQLGIELKPAKRSVEVLIVERVAKERPITLPRSRE